jgi:hypothetical protein
MVGKINSCQANKLLALQRDLMNSGLEVTVTECGATTRNTPLTRHRGSPARKVASTTKTKASRKMSKSAKKSIASGSRTYHAAIRTLREEEALTQKQAVARYKELKS